MFPPQWYVIIIINITIIIIITWCYVLYVLSCFVSWEIFRADFWLKSLLWSYKVVSLTEKLKFTPFVSITPGTFLVPPAATEVVASDLLQRSQSIVLCFWSLILRIYANRFLHKSLFLCIQVAARSSKRRLSNMPPHAIDDEEERSHFASSSFKHR